MSNDGLDLSELEEGDKLEHGETSQIFTVEGKTYHEGEVDIVRLNFRDDLHPIGADLYSADRVQDEWKPVEGEA